MYGVDITQLLRFSCACERYSDFLARHNQLCEHYLIRFSIWPPLQTIQTVLLVPPFFCPALFPRCDAASPRGSIVRFSDGASAFCWWRSSDWHQPIINLPFQRCPLGFSSLLHFFIDFLNFIFIFNLSIDFFLNFLFFSSFFFF